MSAEQGNVQPWREKIERVREALSLMPRGSQKQVAARAALDALTTQIEELERERVIDKIALVGERSGAAIDFARAEKAERALAEIIVEGTPKPTPGGVAVSHGSAEKCAEIARAALRPSGTSDE